MSVGPETHSIAIVQFASVVCAGGITNGVEACSIWRSESRTWLLTLLVRPSNLNILPTCKAVFSMRSLSAVFFPELLSPLVNVSKIWSGASAVTDILIASSMTYLVRAAPAPLHDHS
ncbi:hypothetical protein AN958_01652 [Leucoagaricus sp. SymC.cos]|nr:hypothetical protein AN958_01652 [Leucoagaricus sp. SymC.cos]